MSRSEHMAPRDRFPEDYGPAQRDYDVAAAVYRTVEEFSYAFAALLTASCWRLGWYIAIPAGILCAVLVRRPFKKRYEQASAAWMKELYPPEHQ